MKELKADRTYTTTEIADMFGLKESYLRKLRQLQKGPKYYKLGAMIRYYEEDVANWLKRAMVEVKPKGVV